MTVLSITVICREGQMDNVVCDVDLPNPVYPYLGNNSVLMFAACGEGEAYARKHFPGVPLKVQRC